MNDSAAVKRITIFAGHYGSGKTTISAAYALMLRKSLGYPNVAVCDFDVVNPYFRTLDYRDVFNKNGIRLITSELASKNLETPAMSASVRTIFDDASLTAVIDAGGDGAGALALGRYSEEIKRENNYGMYMVINIYRPRAREAGDIEDTRREIENACGVPFTGIVSNPNLGGQTFIENITDSLEFMDEVSERLRLPIYMTCAREELVDAVKNSVPGYILPVTPHTKPEWVIGDV